MFTYPKNVQEARQELDQILNQLDDKYVITRESFFQTNNDTVEVIKIKQETRTLNRIVLSSGLHGIEGYIGHVCQVYFLTHILPYLKRNVEVVLFHIINPYGMNRYRRANHNNIDLNRNYSKHQFSIKNPEFLQVQSFLAPRPITNKLQTNIAFYTNIIKGILKTSVSTLNTAILKGQKIDPTSIYYTGTSFEPTTKYILSQLDHLYSFVDEVLWLDIHSGFGGQYDMLMINSRYEFESTKKLKNAISYTPIIGEETDELYDTDGDLIEKLYEVHQQKSYQSKLLALCFEFGTLGSSLPKQIKTLKAILLENNQYHFERPKHNKYIKKLMMNAFLPNSDKWKVQQLNNFHNATIELLQYKKLITTS